MGIVEVNVKTVEQLPKVKPQSPKVKMQTRGSMKSTKPKYITNYPCDKCDKVFSERATILEHVKTIHGIVVPGVETKTDQEKKQSDVTKFWQNKAKELEDPVEDNVENDVPDKRDEDIKMTANVPNVTDMSEPVLEDPLNIP